ncbi:lactocepin [Bacillus oleivorans]|uniref:Lactocepin n=1 Tax=Bacillus oleivorans TaxID=1448271 RepID=A0A285CIH7_9BACI|nr:S8 family serine peptidase [Bacillus oleivorans]SNX67319.1 lactocepin [Bacillus oleivorans]
MKAKKSLLIAIISLLCFSTVAFGASVPQKTVTQKSLATGQQSLEASLDKSISPDEEVRVIVELEQEPAITVAQKQGKQYKNLSKAEKEQLKAERKAAQKAVKEQAKAKKIQLKEHVSFTTVSNGFSADVKYGQIGELAAVEGVKEVYISTEYTRPEEEPDMVYSKELIQAQSAWRDYGYKGEGMIVGVIDTGIDPSHKDFVLSDLEAAELSEEEITSLVAENGLPGKFYTDKVPYGYNYIDGNSEIKDLAGPNASMHGMHVAGTVAANGDEENGGIKGVAPEAQVLALKVFSNDPNMASTWGDIYIKAIDDAIVLGADVLNMSLGSTAGFVDANNPEQQAVARAVENGVLMAISAGNSAHLGNGYRNPDVSNPDYGVVGSPGISYDSLQVASIENSFMDLDAITYSFGDTTGKAPFLSASSVHPNDVEQKSFEVVYAGVGGAADFEGLDIEGKYALVVRGTHAFTDKAINAQKAGAAGVIIYNNTSGYVNMATDPAITIPQLFMLKTDGDKLKAALDAKQTVTVSFEGDKTTAANPEAGKMSAFTSWGVTPNLDFKPEITAPGGQIYSTLNNDKYGMMSGTSMAAPHVAGGAALVMQRVDEDFGYEGFDRALMAKNILMNTSSPVLDKGTVPTAFGWEVPYSPRRQGAGLMQLHSALSTPVVVTEKKSGEAKVALKEVGDKFTFTLVAKNYSNETAVYNVAANLQTDFAGWGELGYLANELQAQPILNAAILVNGSEETTVTLKPGQKKNVTVTVDLSNAQVVDPSQSWTTLIDIEEMFESGFWVEGFVTFTDVSDTNPTLTVPYVGFNGDWNKAPIFDGTVYDEASFYGVAGLLDNNYNYLGYNPLADEYHKELIAISPNGDGVQDGAVPAFSLLRNVKQITFSILDENGKEIRKLRTENNQRKHYYDGGRAAYYSLNASRLWDGTINGALAEDGLYYYELEAVIDYPGAEPQTLVLPVKVDTVAPTVEAALSEDGTKVAITASDNEGGSGLSYIDVYVNGESVVDGVLAPSTTEFVLPEGTSPEAEIEVVAVDHAGNSSTATEADDTSEGGSEEGSNEDGDASGQDSTVPYVNLVSPEAFSIFNTNEVVLSGTINEPSGLKEFTVAGNPVETAYNEETKLYEFNTSIQLADGIHHLDVKAVDNEDNEIAFKRMIFVDTTVPVIEVSGVPKSGTVKNNVKSIKVDVTVADNFDEIRLYQNGSEIYYHEGLADSYEMRSFEHVIEDLVLQLQEGENVFTFEATDLAGNTTAYTVKVVKESKK